MQCLFAILNANSGPGASANPDYTTQMTNNHTAGVSNIGYVHTSYTVRPLAAVFDEIDDWNTFYPNLMDGIMADEMAGTTASDACYLSNVYNYIKVKYPNQRLIGNPGMHISDVVSPYADIFSTFEGTANTYVNSYPAATSTFETTAANQNRILHIIHSVDAADRAQVLSLSRTRDAGYVYITDDVMVNPYDQLATYFPQLVAEVGSLPATVTPARGPVDYPAGCLDLSSTASAPTSTQTPTTSTTEVDVTLVNDATSDNSTNIPVGFRFSLPTGYSLTSATGTGWTCSENDCTYSSALAPNASSNPLALSIDATCEATATLIPYSVVGDNNQTFSSYNLAITPPACASPAVAVPAYTTLASTGTPVQNAAGLGVVSLLGSVVTVFLYRYYTRKRMTLRR